MSGPHGFPEPDGVPEGKPGDAAGNGHKRGSAPVRTTRKTVSAVLIVLIGAAGVLFDTAQPDLNWENPEVQAEFADIMRYWLDKGVDGFRVDVAHGLVKASGLPDWHLPHGRIVRPDAAGRVPPMWDQDAVHEIYRAWRTMTDRYPGDRVLVAEALVSPPQRLARYVRADEMHQAFNFDYLQARWNADELRAVITDSLAAACAVDAPRMRAGRLCMITRLGDGPPTA